MSSIDLHIQFHKETGLRAPVGKNIGLRSCATLDQYLDWLETKLIERHNNEDIQPKKKKKKRDSR